MLMVFSSERCSGIWVDGGVCVCVLLYPCFGLYFAVYVCVRVRAFSAAPLLVCWLIRVHALFCACAPVRVRVQLRVPLRLRV